MKRYDQIIFLSTTNTLLGPIAEVIYRKNSSDWLPKAISRGLVVLFEEPIHPKCNQLLTQNGFPMTAHGQSKQLVQEDIGENSLVITMTFSEKVKFTEDFNTLENVYTLGEFVGVDTDIIDPSGAEDDKYQECFEELALRINKLIHKIEKLYWDEENS